MSGAGLYGSAARPDPGAAGRRRPAFRQRQRVYVLPTRFGATYVLVTLGTLVGCINYLLSLGYALTFLLLSLWVVCAVYASRALTGAGVSVRLPLRAFAGQPVPLAVTLTGPSLAEQPLGVRAGPALVWLEAPDPLERSERTRGNDAVATGTLTGTLTLAPLERGPHPLAVLRLEGHDPLGLWRSTYYPLTDPAAVPLPRALLILPAPELNPPPPPLAEQSGLATESRRAPGEEEVHGLREYRPGDAPRRIAWKQAARVGTLLTRTYDAPQAAVLALDWAAAGTGAAGDEARLSRLCAWVLEAERRGSAFSLHLPGDRLEPASGDAQVGRALELLARFGRPPLPPRPVGLWRRR